MSFQPNAPAGVAAQIDTLFPKCGFNMLHPSAAYTTTVPGTINRGYMTRVTFPETGTIIRLMCFCMATGSGNIDYAIYDTTATTRNRIGASSGAVALVATSWVEGTVSIPVYAGMVADLAFGVSSATSSVAGCGYQTVKMSQLPTGWSPAPGGGLERVSSFVNTTFGPSLPATIAEANMVNDTNYPLIGYRYA